MKCIREIGRENIQLQKLTLGDYIQSRMSVFNSNQCELRNIEQTLDGELASQCQSKPQLQNFISICKDKIQNAYVLQKENLNANLYNDHSAFLLNSLCSIYNTVKSV